MNSVDLEGIGRRIQNRRKQMGMTQEQLADRMNVSIQMISNLERGNKAVRIDNLVSLSQILNISTDYILTGSDHTADASDLLSGITSLSDKSKRMVEMLIAFCSREEM